MRRIDLRPLVMGVPLAVGLTVDRVERLEAGGSFGEGSLLLGVEGLCAEVMGEESSASSGGGGERDPEAKRSISRALRFVAVPGVSPLDSS